MPAVSLVPQSLLLSVAVCFLLQGLQTQTLASDLVDLETIVSAATSLYSYRNWQGYHSFYPLATFTCTGKITKVAFITRNSGTQAPSARFATWFQDTSPSGRIRYNRRNYIDAQSAVVTRSTNLYRLYEFNLTLNVNNRLDFETNDVFGIRLAESDITVMNPLNQLGGGWNQYRDITRRNNDADQFNLDALTNNTSFPIVALETDPTCDKGFLKMEALTKFLEANPGSTLNSAAYSWLFSNQQFRVPGMTFNTTGLLKKWKFAAWFRYGVPSGSMPQFQVWRRDQSLGSTLVSENEVTVQPRPTGYLNVFEIVLPETDQVMVMQGDVFGMRIPQGNRQYLLAFMRGSGYNTFLCGGQPCSLLPLVNAEIEEANGGPEATLPQTRPPTSTDSEVSRTQPTDAILTEQGEEISERVTTVTTQATSDDHSATTASAPTTLPSTNGMVGSRPVNSEGTSEETVSATTQSLGSANTEVTKNELTDRPKSTTSTSKDETTTPSVQFAANQSSDTNGPLIGGVVGTLLVLIVGLTVALLLLMLYLMKRKTATRKKMSTTTHALIGADLSNPTYDINVTGSGGNGGAHTSNTVTTSFSNPQPLLYEEPRQLLSPSDDAPSPDERIYQILEAPSSSDMEQPVVAMGTERPIVIENHYEINQQWGLYVPTTQQRNVLMNDSSADCQNENAYSTLEENQYAVLDSDWSSTRITSPKFFEETDTYWRPASNQEGLYEQLSTKKYREILRNQIQLTDPLGSGQFGTVRKGVWQLPGGHSKEVAVKTLQEGATEVDKVKFLQEAAINGQFWHPNVVRLMGVVTVGEPTMIALELLSNGDLKSYLVKMRPTPGELVPSNTPHVLLRFCKEIASGMKYLSGKNFVHRDLAARNILVSADKNCKISDFGMSRDLEDESYYVSHGGKIPVKWTAPEALHYKKYSPASDVWSFGAVMYEIWSLGHKPFEEYTNTKVMKKVDKGFRLPPPPGCPKEMYRIMIQCWNPEKTSRPTFSHLHDELSKNPHSHNLLDLTDQQLGTTELHPQAGVLGAPLEAGKNLYLALQGAYMRQ